MTVCAEGLAIYPRLGNGIDCLVTVETEHLGDDGSGRDFDEDDVIEPGTIERVEESESSLDLVGHNHAFEEILDGEGLALTGKMICHGQNRAKVIRRMSPCDKGQDVG